MPLVILRQAALLLLAVAGYLLLCRRFRVLWHPLAVTVAVAVTGVFASVIGAVIRSGWTEVAAVAWRSTVGSTMWGVLIGAIYWIARMIFPARSSRSRRTSL